MGDLNIKQKTEHARLSAQMQSVKISQLDFDETQVSIDWNTANEDADPTNLSDCTNNEQVSMTVTYTKFNLDFQFSHWFEVASMSIESETGVGTFSIRDATLKVEFKPYLNAERLRLAIVHFDFEFDDHSLVLYRA